MSYDNGQKDKLHYTLLYPFTHTPPVFFLPSAMKGISAVKKSALIIQYIKLTNLVIQFRSIAADTVYIYKSNGRSSFMYTYFSLSCTFRISC